MKRFINYYLAFLLIGCLGMPVVLAQENVESVQVLIEREIYERADVLLDELILTDAKNPEHYYWKGIVQYKMENYPSARDAFEQGIEIKGRYPYNHAGLGMALFKIGKKQEAAESLNKAMELGRKDVGVNLAVARAYLEEGSPRSLKEAEVLLMRAEEKEKGMTETNEFAILMELGKYYLAKDIPELALPQFQKATEVSPEVAEGYALMGETFIIQGKYQDAAYLLQKALKVDPKYAPAYKHMGELWLKAQDFEKARDNYKLYVELTDDDFYANQRYASFLFLTEDYRGTLDVLNSLDTTTNLGWRLKGMAYLELGAADSSKACMKTYFSRIQAAYTIPTDYLTLGKAQYATGEESEAEKNFEKAYEMDRAQVEVWKEIADQCKKSKQFGREARFRKIYIEKKEKGSIRDYYFLGQAQYKAEQYEAADTTFATLVDMRENFTAAHFYRVRIAQKLDPDREKWLAIPHAQAIVEHIGDKEMGELKANERNELKTCYMFLTIHAFDQQPDGTGNCEAAAEYLTKAMAFNPDAEFLLELDKYCNESEKP